MTLKLGPSKWGIYCTPAFKPHMIEAFIAGVRHLASTIFDSSSGGAGSRCATELVNQPCMLSAYQPTGAIISNMDSTK